MKVRVLGLDGMSLDMLRDLCAAGALPHAGRFLEDCHAGDLRSTVPSFTVPGWTSAFTGVPPGDHGLLWWRRDDPALPWREPGRTGFFSMHDAARRPLWSLLEATGRSMTIVDVPGTFPAPRVNGRFVSGFLAPWPDPRAVHPASLAPEVEGWLPPGGAPTRGGAGPAAAIGSLAASTGQRLELFRRACSGSDDLVVFVLVAPDRLSHLAWPDLVPGRGGEAGDAVRRLWSAVDAYFAELIEARGRGEAVLVVSDHGSCPPPRVAFHSRAWLVERGFVERAGAGRVLGPARWQRLRPLRDALRPLLRRIRPPVPGRSFGIAPDAAVADAAMGDHELGLFVRPGTPDAATLRVALADALREVRDADGPVFEAVGDGWDLVGGRSRGGEAPAVAIPDVLAVTRSDVRVSPGSILDEPLRRLGAGTRGMHRREGVLLLAAPEIEADRVAEASVEDVAPTVLALLGFRPPGWMTGRALVRAGPLDPLPSAEGVPSVDGTAGIDAEETAAMEDHLRELGYLE